MATRLDVIVKGASSEARAELQARKIMRVLDNSKQNERVKKEEKDIELKELFLELSGSNNPTKIIESISEKMDEVDECNAKLDRLQAIEDYLNGDAGEDVKAVKKTSKK